MLGMVNLIMRDTLLRKTLFRNTLLRNIQLENTLVMVDLIDQVVIRLAGAGDQDQLNYL